MRKSATIPPEYFEQKYQADIDPWRFRTSAYERDKYRATVAALGQQTYAAALELGCSIGVLTQLLRPRCANLLAIDASATAIEAAKESTKQATKQAAKEATKARDLQTVTFRVAHLPAQFPDGAFDLIVASEVLYYFERSDLERLARSCSGAISPKGEIVLCHWLGETDYPLTGTEASDLFARCIKPALPVRSILHDDVYRLERFAAE